MLSIVKNFGIPAAIILSMVVFFVAVGFLTEFIKYSVECHKERKGNLTKIRPQWIESGFNRWDFILPISCVFIGISAFISHVHDMISIFAFIFIAFVALALSSKNKSTFKFLVYGACYIFTLTLWACISQQLGNSPYNAVFTLLFPSWILAFISFVVLACSKKFARAFAAVGLGVFCILFFEIPIIGIIAFFMT